MPPGSAGNIITKDDWNRTYGELAETLERLALIVPDVKAVQDAQTSAQWAAQLGMLQSECDVCMTAGNKAKELVDIYTGAATKPVAEDFRQWMRPVRGLSSII